MVQVLHLLQCVVRELALVLLKHVVYLFPQTPLHILVLRQFVQTKAHTCRSGLEAPEEEDAHLSRDHVLVEHCKEAACPKDLVKFLVDSLKLSFFTYSANCIK